MRNSFPKIILIIALLFMASSSAQTDFNPKAVDYIKLKITQSGQLTTLGNIKAANLTLYVPQEDIENLVVTSSKENAWNYAKDKLGNKVVVI